METNKPRNIFLRILCGFWRFLDQSRRAVANILFLVIVIALFAVALKEDKSFTIEKGSALVLKPHGIIVDQKTYRPPIDKLMEEASGGREERPETALQDILDVLRNAASDKRISALVLDLDALQGAGLNKLQTIGHAIEKFKASGKPVIAKAVFYDQNRYYLAAYADEIYTDPEGGVMITGYGRYRTYFKSLLDNIGVKYHVFKVGTYKSAVEPFIRDNMSEAAKEANMRWLSVLWDAYKQDVAKARGLTPEDIENYVLEMPQRLKTLGGDFTKLAVESRLVDGTKDDIAFNDYMKSKVGAADNGKTFRKVSFYQYLKEIRPVIPKKQEHPNQIALIHAVGPIMDGEQPEGRIGGDTLARLIRKARLNDKVKAIVMRVDSPGGSAYASEVIRREILAAQKAGKKVVVSMSTYAASGGYWISANADQIWAQPTTITGSIGIFGMLPTFEKPMQKIGIHRDGVGTTPLTNPYDPMSGMDPQFAEMFQQAIYHGYDRFLEVVAKGRGMTKAQVDKIAQGRVWIGVDAKKLGLVDELGGLDKAIESAAKLASIEDDYEVIEIKREHEPFDELLDKLFAKVGWPTVSVPLLDSQFGRQMVTTFKPVLDRLSRMNDPRGIYVDCLCTLEP